MMDKSPEWDKIFDSININYDRFVSQEISDREFKYFLSEKAYDFFNLRPDLFNLYPNNKNDIKVEIEENAGLGIFFTLESFFNSYNDKSKIKDSAAALFLTILKQKMQMLIYRSHENEKIGNIFNDEKDNYDSYQRRIWRKCKDSYVFYKSNSRFCNLTENEIIKKIADNFGITEKTVKDKLSISELSFIYSTNFKNQNITIDVKDDLYDFEADEKRLSDFSLFTKVLDAANQIWKQNEKSDTYVSFLFTAYVLKNLPSYINLATLKKYDILNNTILDKYLSNPEYEIEFTEIDKMFDKKIESTNKRKRFLQKIKNYILSNYPDFFY